MVHISAANLGIKIFTHKPHSSLNRFLITILLKYATKRHKSVTVCVEPCITVLL